MLEVLFGSKIKEKTLLFIYANKESYAREIASTFGYSLFPVQKQLRRLENAGILVEKRRGRTNIFTINPRFPFKAELLALLDKILYFTSKEEKDKYYMLRLRPRRHGKPLWK